MYVESPFLFNHSLLINLIASVMIHHVVRKTLLGKHPCELKFVFNKSRIYVEDLASKIN